MTILPKNFVKDNYQVLKYLKRNYLHQTYTSKIVFKITV